MKHIIYSDIDGTIYPRTKVLHPQTPKDIKQAQDRNIEFVLCTGNAHMDNVEDLAQKLNVRYTVTSNGAAVKDRTTNEYLFTSTIPKEKAQALLDFANENKIGAN